MTREVDAVEYYSRGVEGEKIRRRLRQKMRVWQDALDEPRARATSMRAYAADAHAGARSRVRETQRCHWPFLSSHEAQRCACGGEVGREVRKAKRGDMSNSGDKRGDWHTGTRPRTLFGVGALGEGTICSLDSISLFSHN